MMGLLRDKYTPETLPYHVVVPSLPGYTLSDGPPLDADFSIGDVARILNQLMIDLGFGDRGYIAQGGDVGGMVARMMAPYKECRAAHGNIYPLSVLSIRPLGRLVSRVSR
jgi:microsomal epoxide hydrolase